MDDARRACSLHAMGIRRPAHDADITNLWTVNPDGSALMVYFGNQHPGGVILDAKPIPGTDKVVASFAPGHGRTEHAGVIAIIDPSRGPDDMSDGPKDRQAVLPRPLSALRGPFSRGRREGAPPAHVGREDRNDLPAARAGRAMGLPRTAAVAAPAPRAGRAIPFCQDPHDRPAVCCPTSTRGRNMAGIRPGEIKKLLVLEQLPRPANFSNGQEPLTVGGTFMLERILGTVPVEEDGSAYLEVPALRSLFFVALDEDDLSVKRMQSSVTVQPGETTALRRLPRAAHPRASFAELQHVGGRAPHAQPNRTVRERPRRTRLPARRAADPRSPLRRVPSSRPARGQREPVGRPHSLLHLGPIGPCSATPWSSTVATARAIACRERSGVRPAG